MGKLVITICETYILLICFSFYKPLYLLFALALPVLIPVVAWDEKYWNSLLICYFSRYVVLLHITWLVNSAAHFYGTKPYDKWVPSIQNKIPPIIRKFQNDVGGGEFHSFLSNSRRRMAQLPPRFPLGLQSSWIRYVVQFYNVYDRFPRLYRIGLRSEDDAWRYGAAQSFEEWRW